MNLEQLQQSWNKLSERLEREEVIRKQELRLVMENKVTSYRNRIRLNQILGWVVLLCTVGILFVQGIQSDPFGWIVIGTVVVMDVLLFAPMYSIIMRLAKFDSNIIEQEKMIIRFEKMFVRNSIVIAKNDDLFYMFHGDVTYTDEALYANKLSVVFEDIEKARETLDNVREFVKNNPTVYLSTHTPLGHENLENKSVIDFENPPESIYPK